MGKFIYWNQNPNNLTEPDCVCRAISLTTGIDYYRVEEMLSMVGDYYCCEDLFVGCYRHLLNNIFGFPKVEGVEGLTIGEFSDEFPQGIFLVRVEGHLSSVVNSYIIDIFDCSDMIITDVWRVIM